MEAALHQVDWSGRLKAPIHFEAQFHNPFSCYRKPVEGPSEIEHSSMLLVRSTGFLWQLIGSWDRASKWIGVLKGASEEEALPVATDYSSPFTTASACPSSCKVPHGRPLNQRPTPSQTSPHHKSPLTIDRTQNRPLTKKYP